MTDDINDCGCCAGADHLPGVRFNPPGLPAIDYRIGRHGEFKAALLARLSSTDYPALVGGPLATADAQLPDREDVEVPAIATLARRAIANYLRGDLPNLRADLASDATVTLPAQSMRVEEIAAVQWASARREAVQIRVVAADETGATWTYSYELGVRQEASDWRIAWIDTLATET